MSINTTDNSKTLLAAFEAKIVHSTMPESPVNSKTLLAAFEAKIVHSTMPKSPRYRRYYLRRKAARE